MRAIVYDRFGPASEVLQLVDLPTPDPAPGEVLVRLVSSGVNPSDIRAREGGRPGVIKPPFPQIIPHSDGAGVIEAVGEGVEVSRIGERVWIWNGQWRRPFGTAADYIALPSAQAVPLPDAASFDEGAILGIPGLTAAHAVMGGGNIEGKTLLVSGGAGTVGNLAIQMAVKSGARVLATARGEEGQQACRDAGADQVFDYGDPDLPEAILGATNGELIDRIIEVEFGRNIDTNTKVIAECGTIAAYGSAQEMSPVFPFYPLLFKAITLDIVLVYLLNASERAAAISTVNGLLEQGALNLRVSKQFDLKDCAAAHDVIASGARAGSVILHT